MPCPASAPARRAWGCSSRPSPLAGRRRPRRRVGLTGPAGTIDRVTEPAPKAPLYKGEPLDAERGPGLGCFWSQVAVLAFLIVLTPLTVIWVWPPWISAVLLFAIIV